MIRLGGRRLGLWLALALVGALGASQAAKPTVEVWAGMKAQIVVVTPDSPASCAWVQTRLNNLPIRVVHPRDWAANPALQKNEQVLVIYRHDQKDQWPDGAIGKLSRNPATVAADEVLVYSQVVGKGVWQSVVVAPDATQAQQAVASLATMDSQLFTTSPAAMLNWKLIDGLGIGMASNVLSTWLNAQGSQTQRVRARTCSPVSINPDWLRTSGVTVTALTYREWRDLGGTAQDVLKFVLPGNVVDALNQGVDHFVVAGVENAEGKIRIGVAAPNERFIAAVLSTQSLDETVARLFTEVGAVRVTSTSSTGGTWELKDLRPYPKVVVAAAILGNQRQETASDIAYKLRQTLTEAGRWQFIDDQAVEASIRRQLQEGAFGSAPKVETAGADALMVARLHHVERRTEFAEGQTRRLTPEPTAFTDSEPSKPDPEARQYVIAGPKVYPQGANDPKYQQDLRTWQDKHNDWEAKRNQYQRDYDNANVLWEQNTITSQTVRIDGILEVYSRAGLLLCSVPLNTQLTKSITTPSRVTVRGHGSAPNAVGLPPMQESVPEPLVNEAAAKAAKDAATLLLTIALSPKDGGAALPPIGGGQVAGGGTPAVGGGTTPAGGGTVAAGGQPTAVVRVKGLGKLADGEQQARRQAQNDALRNAVEQGVGVYVESNTKVDKFELIEDRILTRAQGFAAIKSIVKEAREGDSLALDCEVEVFSKPLRDQLVAMGLARQWRVMICVPEQHLRRVVPDPAAENALMRQFIQAGLPVIDKAQSDDLRQNQQWLLQVAGNLDLAHRLRAKYNAEILVTGEAFSQDIDPIAGQTACRARLEIKAVDLNTAEVLAAEDQHSTGTDQTSELAGKVALRRAADDVAERFIDMIYRRPMPTAGMARVEITLTGFRGFTQADKFKRSLAKIDGVSNVRQLEFAAGVLKVEVELSQGAVENLPVALESDPQMQSFKIAIDQVTTGTISGTVKGD